MNNYPNIDPLVSNANAKVNSIIEAGKANAIKFGSHFDTAKGPGGTTLRPVKKNQAAVLWRDVYAFTNSVAVNEAVYEASGSTYTDSFGANYTSQPGSWVCYTSIPQEYNTTDRAAINASNVPAAVKTAWLRQPGSDYTPKTGSAYWRPLGSSGGGSGISYQIYNYSSSYAQYTFVRTDKAVQYTDGTNTKWQYPGVWIATKAVPALSGSYPSGSRGVDFAVPVLPTGSYFDFIGFAPTQRQGCDSNGNFVTVWSQTQDYQPSGSQVIHI